MVGSQFRSISFCLNDQLLQLVQDIEDNFVPREKKNSSRKAGIGDKRVQD